MSRLWVGDTTTDYLTIPATTLWNMNTDVVVMGIVRTDLADALANYNISAAAIGTAARGWNINRGGAGAGRMEVGLPGGAGISCIDLLPQNTWVAFMVYLSTGVNFLWKLYNYTTLTSRTLTNSGAVVIPSTDGGWIGQRDTLDAPSCWHGDIDRIMIAQCASAGVAPTNANFQAWARAGTIPPELTVKGYWILSPSGTATSPEVDLSGNGNNITTITGTTASAAFVLPDAPTGLSFTVSDVLAARDTQYQQV